MSLDIRIINLNMAKKSIVLAHEILLASVGIYDSGREIMTDKFDQLFFDSSKLFNDLLQKGEALEAQIQAKIEAKKMLQDKISALKARLGFGNESRDQQIDMLSQRVDSLIEAVAKLAQQKAAEKKVTTPASISKKVAPKVTKASAKAEATKPAVVKVTATKPSVAKVTAAKPAVVDAVVSKTAVGEPAGKSKVDGKD